VQSAPNPEADLPLIGGTVYGAPSQSPIDETLPTDPISAYGINKLTIGKYVQMHARVHGLDCRIIRLSNPYGPFQIARKGQGLITELIRRSLCNIPIEVWGDGSTVRDYIYIDDAVNAMIRACVAKSESRIFNVGSGHGLSISNLVEAITKLFGRSPPVIYKEARGFDVKKNVLSIERATRELRWAPQTSLEQGLLLATEWMQAYLNQSGSRVAG
jgi:UDP-glucose 4-epimerase